MITYDFQNSAYLKVLNYEISKEILDYIYNYCLKKKQCVAAVIDVNDIVIAQMVMTGCSPLIIKLAHQKLKSAKLVHNSSSNLYNKFSGDKLQFLQKYGLSAEEYCILPGAIVIRDETNRPIGFLSISGLKKEEDHELALLAVNSVNNKE